MKLCNLNLSTYIKSCEKGWLIKLEKRTLFSSFKYAIEGISYAFKTQRNIKIHFSALIVLIISVFLFQMKIEDIVLLLFCAMSVIVSEMLNTAIEKTIDLYTNNYHPLAKIAKDVAAGAVLISAIFTLIISCLIISKYI